MHRRNLTALVLVLVTGALMAWVLQAASDQEAEDAALFEQYDRFIEVVRLVQKQYVREVDTEELFQEAIDGMLSGLDPFSTYVDEEHIDEFTKQTRGKFGGIGIQIGMRQGMLTVISPLEGTPAFRQGVMAGDVILAIDGKRTDDITLTDAVKILTGDPGTDVTIKVRHLTGDIADITITRAIIEIRTVKGFRRDDEGHWDWMIDPEKHIAYIRVTGFVDNTVEELTKALDEARAGGMKALIMDLRLNPGGQLKSAIEMVDLFVKEGIIVQTKGRTTPYWEATATAGGTLPFFPMAVLISPFSASASEIVSGALKDHNRAILVGERSFGKGSVQNVIPLEGDRAALKLTTSKYYLPSGRNIHREEDMEEDDEWGVVPDVVVPLDPQGYVAIARSRQQADVIQTNGNGDGNGQGGAAPDGTGDTPPDDETPGQNGAGDAPDAPEGGAAAPPKEDGGDPPADPFDILPDDEGVGDADPEAIDPQLQRALDLLRTLDVVEQYLKQAA